MRPYLRELEIGGSGTPAIRKALRAEREKSVLAKRQSNLVVRSAGGVGQRSVGPGPIRSLVDFVLRVIWRRRGLVVLLTALALLPAVAYVRLATPLYTATATILIGPSTGDAADGRLMSSTVPPGTLSAQRSVIVSTPVLAAALAAPAVKDCDPLRDHAEPIEFLRHALNVEGSDGNLLAVSISSTSADDATCIVAAVVQSYTHFLSSLRRNGNSEALSILQTQRAKQQADLSAKSADLMRFAKEHHVGGADVSAAGAAELTRLAETLNEVHLAAISAKNANDDLQRELAQDPARAQSLKWFEESTPTSQSADAQDPEMTRSELLSLKERQAELAQKFMPGHPALLRIQARIDELTNRRDAAIENLATSTAQREADMQRTYNQEEERVLDQTTHQSEYVHRSEEVAAAQKSVDEIDRRINNLGTSDNSGLPTVTVLDAAAASAEPTSPNRRRILLIAALAGLFLSSLAVCWLERGRMSVVGHADLQLGLPILAELPTLPTDFGPLSAGSQQLVNGQQVLDEIFQGLNSIVEGAVMRGRGVIALVTSPSRGDGKSTLASNLAVSLAKTRKRVLLVDADLRSHAQASIFGIGNATGLATLLEAEVSHPITSIHHTGMPSLDVIPSGPVTRNPAELVNSQRFIDLMGDLAERYDYVVVDSPPTVTFSEARTISASCDLTIMVMRTDMLNRRMYDLASDGLTTVGANLCGIVLNSGMDDERSDAILRGMKNDRPEEKEPIEKLATRKLAVLMVAAAKAVDLVRMPPTNQRVGPRLLLASAASLGKGDQRSLTRKVRSTAPRLIGAKLAAMLHSGQAGPGPSSPA